MNIDELIARLEEQADDELERAERESKEGEKTPTRFETYHLGKHNALYQAVEMIREEEETNE